MPESNNKIALLRLSGPILNKPDILFDLGILNNKQIIYSIFFEDILKEYKNQDIKGLIISIDSPGGSVSASYYLKNVIEDFAIQNNILIYFHTNELLASGGYWVALAGKKIYASYGSLIGSIGVKGPDWIYYDEPISYNNNIFGGIIETKKGIKKFSNTAGNSKDLFDPFRAPTKKEKRELKNTVENVYNDFVLEVSKKRKIEKENITKDIGAMIFDAETAKQKFLIDKVATIDEVIFLMTKDLNLNDYQVIERDNRNPNFIKKIMSSNYIFEDILIKNYNSQINSTCEMAKFSISAILLQNKFTSIC